MIDVLKRLAELDAKNPNVKTVIKESADVAECGPMGMMSSEPKTPATINITAGDGEQLGSMLAALMQLAGVHKVGDEHMGSATPATIMTSPSPMGHGTSAGDDMRSVIDKLNPEDEEATDEGQYDTSPNDPTDIPPYDEEGLGPNHHENQPQSGSVPKDHEMRPRDRNQPVATFENLMAEYKKFVTESTLTESSYEDILKQYPTEVQDFKNGGDLDYDLQSALWDYHFNKGDIRNYDADASEYIGQNLADFLGVAENNTGSTMNTMMQGGTRALGGNADHVDRGEEDIDQFVNGNRKNFNGVDEEDFDKAQQMFVNFLKKKGINVDNINDDAYPVLVAMCQGKMCAWYDLENAHGYVAMQDDEVDEAAQWRDPKHKGNLYTQEPDDGEGDRHDYYRDSRPENDPGEKRSTFNRSKDTDKLHYPYGDYQVGQKAQVGDRAKKGLLTKNSIRVVKNRINGTQGDHPRPNLPK